MASSGKKGKKSKGTVISLQSFLADEVVPAGTTQVAKKIRNVDGEESDDGANILPLVYQLPTAPRAHRAFDEELVPHKPPYIAHVTNLPFDVNEDDINIFFGGISLLSIRLPREDGETGRVRGFGYIEFESREDLVDALNLPDPSLKGRRIRIELSNENESNNNRQRSNRRGFDGLSSGNEGRESTNWRQEASKFTSNFEKGFVRKVMHDGHGETGSWRIGNRPPVRDFSPKKDRSFESLREHGGGSKVFERNAREQITTESLKERPKLILNPRTLPLPEIVPKFEEEYNNKTESDTTMKQSGTPYEKVFGAAKPVDTAARELEIEGRMREAQRQEQSKREKNQAEVNVKFAEIHLAKTEKENTNTAISWRRKNDTNFDIAESRNKSLDRKQFNRDRDIARYKEREQSERDIIKPNTERTMLNLQSNNLEAVRPSSNKYFGLDDEATE